MGAGSAARTRCFNLLGCEIAADVTSYAERKGITRDSVQIPGLYEWDSLDW